MKITDSARLRIAVALVILRHKPRNRSCIGYLLDVRSRFPVKGLREDEIQEPWRERAYFLEEEIQSLKRKAALDSSELEVLRATIPTPNQDAGLEEPPITGAPPKKKRKRTNLPNKENAVLNVQAHSHLSELQAVLSGLTLDKDLPSVFDPLNVFAAYQKLLVVSTKDIRSSDFLACLFPSATHLLKALGELLRSILLSHRQLPRNSLEIIKTISIIVDSVLTYVLDAVGDAGGHSRSSKQLGLDTYLDEFLGSLTTDLFAPSMKSFVHVSQCILFPTFQGTKATGKKPARAIINPSAFQVHSDIRPCLLALFKKLLSRLQSDTNRKLPRSGEILDFVALSAVTEVSKLYMIDGNSPCSFLGIQNHLTAMSVAPITERTGNRPERETRLTRDDRICRLARKEALWYLIAIAHDALYTTTAAVREISPKSTGRSELFALVQAQITDILSGLLVQCTSEMYHEGEVAYRKETCERGLGYMDETEKGLIVGLLERVWLKVWS